MPTTGHRMAIEPGQRLHLLASAFRHWRLLEVGGRAVRADPADSTVTEHLLRIGNWRNRPGTPVAVHLPYVLPAWEKEPEGCVFHRTMTLPPGMAHLPIRGENVHV